MLDRAYLPRPLAVVVPCRACCVIVASSCRALLPRVVVASSCRVPCRHGVIVPPIAVVLPPIKPNLDSPMFYQERTEDSEKGKNQTKSKDIAIAKLYYY